MPPPPTAPLPRLPAPCAVCGAARAAQLVPDRAVGTWRFDVMCAPCLDALLGALVGVLPRVRARELLGRLPPPPRRRR